MTPACPAPNNIIDRLRQGVDPDNIRETEAIMDRGADEIERLNAENNVLHKTDKWRYETVLQAKAEIERLRTALKTIADDPPGTPPEAVVEDMREWARRALGR